MQSQEAISKLSAGFHNDSVTMILWAAGGDKAPLFSTYPGAARAKNDRTVGAEPDVSPIFLTRIFLTPLRSSGRDFRSEKLGSGKWPLASGRIQPRLSEERSAAEPWAARAVPGD